MFSFWWEFHVKSASLFFSTQIMVKYSFLRGTLESFNFIQNSILTLFDLSHSFSKKKFTRNCNDSEAERVTKIYEYVASCLKCLGMITCRFPVKKVFRCMFKDHDLIRSRYEIQNMCSVTRTICIIHI